MTQVSLLPASWDVPLLFRNRLGAKVGRQRPMAADGHLLLVLHAPPKPDQSDRVGRFFWRAPEGGWQGSEFGSGLSAVEKHLEEYEAVLAQLERSESEAKLASEYLEVLEKLAPLQRASSNQFHVLQEARSSFPDYRELIDLRDRAYEIQRTAELLFAETKNTLEVLVAKRAEEQSKSSEAMAVASHRLNVLAAFFFPIATLTAVFGTNLTHGLEEESPPGPFLGVVAIGLVLGAILTMFITRKPK